MCGLWLQMLENRCHIRISRSFAEELLVSRFSLQLLAIQRAWRESRLTITDDDRWMLGQE